MRGFCEGGVGGHPLTPLIQPPGGRRIVTAPTPSASIAASVEERDRVGGRVWTIDKGGFKMDLGTAVYLGIYKAAIDLIHELGLTKDFTERDAVCVIPRGGTNHYLGLTKPVRAGLSTKALTLREKLVAVKLGATYRRVLRARPQPVVA